MSLGLASGPTPGWAAAVTADSYEACRAESDEAFARAIEAVTEEALGAELKGIDYEAAVAIEWRRLGLDGIIDKRVDAAVGEVREAESWGGLIKSLGNQEKAQELALAVAEKVYHSEAMRTAIEGLASAVGTEVGRRIELASADAARPALQCLAMFLGPRYGSAVASAVTGDAGRELGLEAGLGGAEISSGTVLKQSSEGITGAAVLLLRRQLANMAQRLGQRLAGSILSRLVSVAAGGVGLVLIAKDIWDLRHGVLPIIADEMKSKDTKEKVRAELAKSLAEEIGRHVRDIAAKSAERVVDVWQEFKRAHAKAIELAGRDETFKRVLSSIGPASFARLDEVLSLLLAAEGEAGILSRAGDGTLSAAVGQLPEAGMTIARETGSVAKALSWSAVAGHALGKVAEYGLHRGADPGTFTSASLDKLLRLDDAQAARHLAETGRSARDVLLDLDTLRLRPIAQALEPAELEALSGYLTGLEKGPRARVLEAIAGSPQALRTLASRRVRDAVVGSRDQAAAVDMMIGTSGNPAATIAAEIRAVWDGRVHPLLLWEKHPAILIGASVGLLLLLLWLKRLIAPQRLATP